MDKAHLIFQFFHLRGLVSNNFLEYTKACNVTGRTFILLVFFTDHPSSIQRIS